MKRNELIASKHYPVKICKSSFGPPKFGGVPGGDIKPHRATPGLDGRKRARLRRHVKIGTSEREMTKAGQSDFSEAAVSVPARWSRRLHLFLTLRGGFMPVSKTGGFHPSPCQAALLHCVCRTSLGKSFAPLGVLKVFLAV